MRFENLKLHRTRFEIVKVFVGRTLRLNVQLAGDDELAVIPGRQKSGLVVAGRNLAAVFEAGGVGRVGLAGIALGSLALNGLSNWLGGSGLLHWNLLVTPLAAALQAGLSAWMVRRWVGYPNALDTPGRVLGFLALGGPLGCLVNASVSVPLLVALGIVPPPEGLFSWWNWWLGDALGVVLSTPLLLVLWVLD